MSYLNFLFDSQGNLKPSHAPVLYYKKKTDSFILKYSIPGYHQPRQSFSFVAIPDQFPNPFLSDIFHYFSITNSLLFRHPSRIIPKPKQSLINSFFNIKLVPSYSQDEIDTASYNLNLALKLGRTHHSLFYFDSYLEAYKVLHPELKFTKSVISSVQKQFNSLISC